MQRRTFNLHQMIHRHRLRVRIEIGQLRNQASPLQARLAHANNPAAANFQARLTHMTERVEPILIITGRDDVAIKFGRRVEIVIIKIQPRFFQTLGLRFLQHAQGGAGFHSQCLDGLDHFFYGIEIAVFR